MRRTPQRGTASTTKRRHPAPLRRFVARPAVHLLAGLVPVLASLSCSQAASGQVAEEPGSRPRLVVLCSIDQMASWVFAEALPHLAEDGGFRRLMREGVRFTHCAYRHACTETGPGHATIGTGAPAAVHGIVRNAWWSRSDAGLVYCAGGAAEALPGLGEGRDRNADRLLAETLSARMRREIPGTRTASVAWKDRSAILMVGNHADVAAWFEVTTGNLVTNKNWCAEVPPWIASWNRERVIDSFYGTVWDRIGPDSAYEGLVDDRPYEVVHQNGSNSHTLPQPLTGGRDDPDVGYWTQLSYSPFGNEVVGRAVQACVDGMQLGRDEVPDLLAVGFSATDYIGHYFGPCSVEARDALLRLDRQLGQLLAFLDERVGVGRYAIFVTADHGVTAIPEWNKAHGVDAGRGLIQTRARAVAERVITERFGKLDAARRYCTYVGEWALVFDRAAFERGDGAEAAAARHAEACGIAAAAVAEVPGLAAAYATADILDGDNSGDEIRGALQAALHPERAGDVQLVVKPHWIDGMLPASHGTPHAYDREVIAFAMGPGIRAGAVSEESVTPGLGVALLAELLGIEPPAQLADAVPAELRSAR
ncbi:MAG: alkaline phosphatase family protein [Planctomycetes bacterium]|nr:alkaline phosphatase family protein [Planctomycetota bacterium]